MKKTFAIISACLTIFISSGLRQVHAQTAESGTLDPIHELKKQKVHSRDTTGPLLTQVLNELMSSGYSPGQLKQQLFVGMSAAKVHDIATMATTERESKLLLLLYHSRPGLVPHFITDSGLKSIFERHGNQFLAKYHKQMNRDVITDDLVEVLELYSPANAVVISSLCASAWYHNGPRGVSYASERLLEMTYYVRQNELAKRSLVLRLLKEEGMIYLPTQVNVIYDWSGHKPTPIKLGVKEWATDDIAGLERLLDNPYYGWMARRQLDRMQVIVEI